MKKDRRKGRDRAQGQYKRAGAIVQEDITEGSDSAEGGHNKR